MGSCPGSERGHPLQGTARAVEPGCPRRSHHVFIKLPSRTSWHQEHTWTLNPSCTHPRAQGARAHLEKNCRISVMSFPATICSPTLAHDCFAVSVGVNTVIRDRAIFQVPVDTVLHELLGPLHSAVTLSAGTAKGKQYHLRARVSRAWSSSSGSWGPSCYADTHLHQKPRKATSAEPRDGHEATQ